MKMGLGLSIWFDSLRICPLLIFTSEVEGVGLVFRYFCDSTTIGSSTQLLPIILADTFFSITRIRVVLNCLVTVVIFYC